MQGVNYQDKFREFLLERRDINAAKKYYNKHEDHIKLNGFNILHVVVTNDYLFDTENLATIFRLFGDGFDLMETDEQGRTAEQLLAELRQDEDMFGNQDDANATMVDVESAAHIDDMQIEEGFVILGSIQITV